MYHNKKETNTEKSFTFVVCKLSRIVNILKFPLCLIEFEITMFDCNVMYLSTLVHLMKGF